MKERGIEGQKKDSKDDPELRYNFGWGFGININAILFSGVYLVGEISPTTHMADPSCCVSEIQPDYIANLKNSLSLIPIGMNIY